MDTNDTFKMTDDAEFDARHSSEEDRALPSWPEPEFELLLRKPVEQPGGEPLTSIMLREPTCAEWDAIHAQPIAQRRRFSVHKITGLPMAVISQVGIGDMAIAENYITSFFAIAQEIGGR
jgi:hypothetical protein